MLIFILLSLIGIISVRSHYEAHEKHQHEFEKFIKNHKRSFSNHSEKARRFAIFKDNLVQIGQLNKRYNTSDMFGVTQFADWTKEEFKKILMDPKYIQPSDNSSMQVEPPAVGGPIVGAGQSVDYRPYVTSIKNQGCLFGNNITIPETLPSYRGQCGACWSFATIANVEALYKRSTGQELDLSEQSLVDCDTQSMGCYGGYPNSAFETLKNIGTTHESSYRYEGVKKNCRLNAGGTHRVTSHTSIQAGFANTQNYLLTKGPFVGTVMITHALQYFKGGQIYRPTETECAYNIGGHAWFVVGLGYEGSQPYYIIKNSWGTTWGEQGYIRFAAGGNYCQTETHSYAATL